MVRHADAAAWTRDLRYAIHPVPYADGRWLDMRLQGSEQMQSGGTLLVCFSRAAVNRSERSAPFFHGARVAQTMGLPILLIADPSITLSSALNLA